MAEKTPVEQRVELIRKITGDDYLLFDNNRIIAKYTDEKFEDDPVLERWEPETNNEQFNQIILSLFGLIKKIDNDKRRAILYDRAASYIENRNVGLLETSCGEIEREINQPDGNSD